MSLTVVLTNYRRPDNVPVILDAIGSQTLRPEIFVWDNSPDSSFRDTRANWVVSSSRNAGCSARWWLAQRACTEWVIVMDDDLVPADSTVLEDAVSKLSEHFPHAVGAAGVILNPQRKYFNCRHVGLDYEQLDADIEVDILKGRFVGMATERLRGLIGMNQDDEDDIIVSSVIGGGIVAASLFSRFRELSTGDESWSHRPHHSARREAARRTYFDK